MELDQILKLIDAVSESSLTNFSLDDGNVKLTFAANRAESAGIHNEPEVIVQTQMTQAAKATQATTLTTSTQAGEGVQEQILSGHEVKSPLVGIYYSANSPQDPPLVKVGDVVKKGQVLGIVEAMKLMNEIESDFDGVVKQILVENQQLVEYGQPMFIIE